MTNPETPSDRQSDPAADGPTVANTPRRGRRPADFAELARSIRSRTVDVIAIAIVAAAVLSLAGWVSEWWRNDPAAVTAGVDILPPAPWESPGGVSLQFGDQPWTMHRRQFVGDEASATAALSDSCIAILDEPAGRDVPGEPDTAELQLLDALEPFEPSARRDGEWAVYELGGFLPWVVGVRHPISGTGRNPEHRSRVLCWGLALPQPDGSWVLHTINRGGHSGSPRFDDSLPLPAGTTPSLQLVDGEGGRLICFSGVGDVAHWSRELDIAWGRSGWVMVREWTTSGGARSAVFARTTDEGVQLTAEVVLSDTGTTEAVGTIIITNQFQSRR